MDRNSLWLALSVAIVAAGFSGCGNATKEAEAMDEVGSFNFRLEIDGIDAGQWTAVDGLSMEMEIIEYQEGGDVTIRKRPGRTKYSNITLKRGYIASDDLWEWTKQVLDGALTRRNGAVILMDPLGNDLVRYNFFEAWPCKWKGFTFDERGLDVEIEEMTLAVERLERVSDDPPVDDRADKKK